MCRVGSVSARAPAGSRRHTQISIMCGVFEGETLLGGVGRFREATGVGQSSRCKRGEGTGHWRWTQRGLGSAMPEGNGTFVCREGCRE